MKELIKLLDQEGMVYGKPSVNKIGEYVKVAVSKSEFYEVYVKNGIYILRYYYVHDGSERRGRSFETADAQKAVDYIKEII